MHRSVAILLVMTALMGSCAVTPNQYGRGVDKTAEWEQVGDKLLTNFVNMYNLHIVKVEGNAAYPFKGWFFGWATDQCNSGAAGCDAIYAARAKSISGPWEVFSGFNDSAESTWDATMNPELWTAVLAAGEANFHNWHNGDPSVVLHNGLYHMLYSATGFNRDGIPFGDSGDTDSDISVVMAAVSHDGLTWSKSDVPVLLYSAQWGQSTGYPEEYMHSLGSYHRPSLMIEDDTFRVWFDGYDNGSYQMLYAENTGNFMDHKDWKIVRGLENPALPNFPNPDVVKLKDIYLAFGDPQAAGEQGWSARKITWAASLNGLDWMPIGRLSKDDGWRSIMVPEAFTVDDGPDVWVYLAYGTTVLGHYHQDSIRMKRQLFTSTKIEQLRAALQEQRQLQ